MVRPRSLFYLVLFGCAVGAAAGPRQATRSGAAPSRWEKAYAEPGGVGFKAVYSVPMQLRRTSALNWLWLGDSNGFVRVVALDLNSAASLGPQPGIPAPYFGLSRVKVGRRGEADEQAGAPVNALAFLDEGSGYLLKGNRLYMTEDAGFSWRPIYEERDPPDGGVAMLVSLSVTPSKRACIAGWYTRPKKMPESLLVCSARSLEHDDPQWRRIDAAPKQAQFFNVHFLDDRRGWVVGTKGTVLKTENGGRAWKKIREGPESLLQTYFVDEDKGWAVGRLGVVLSTRDGGHHWEPTRVRFDRGAANVTLRGVGFADDRKNGWIVGEQGTILHTDNGGLMWHQQQPPAESRGRQPDLHALFVDKDVCWTVGDSGAVWRYRLR
jgi:photosystem II stability/assembly factor-like uncharacterized protein